MTLYHASNEIVQFPEIRKAKYTKDFSWGFYCTNHYQQAVRWANKKGKTPIVNIYNYEPSDHLSILKFDEMNDAWLDFIVQCRSGKCHQYDIVEGAMADDTIWNYINDFLFGDITREQFWVLTKFKYPTHQISFHTLSAIDCLTYERSEILYDWN